MAGIDVSLDTEAVQITVNLINEALEDADKRHKEFLAQVEEAIQISNNRFEPLKQLRAKLDEETQNAQTIVASLEETRRVIDRYADLAAEANSTEYFA